MSGEDSGHTSILCQERTVNTPQSWPGENSEHTSILARSSEHTSILVRRGYIPTYQERPHLDPVGEKHLDP